MNPDQGFLNLTKVIDDWSTVMDSLNEADTRAKIIDSILKDCLGWSERDIKREDHVHVGYTDYQLLVDGSLRLIIEAKKAGEYFEIPTDSTRRTFKIDGVLSTIRNLADAIDQVAK